MKEIFSDGLKECDHFHREGFLMIGFSVPNLEDILIVLIVRKLQAGREEFLQSGFS